MFPLLGSPVSSLGIQLSSAVCHLSLIFMSSYGYAQQQTVSRALKIAHWDQGLQWSTVQWKRQRLSLLFCIHKWKLSRCQSSTDLSSANTLGSVAHHYLLLNWKLLNKWGWQTRGQPTSMADLLCFVFLFLLCTASLEAVNVCKQVKLGRKQVFSTQSVHK